MPNYCIILVLSHSDQEPNKHRMYYKKIKDGDDKTWCSDWKYLPFDTEVIDFCFGINNGLLFVARKGQHIEQYKVDEEAKELKQTLFKTIDTDLEISQITLLYAD